MRTYPRFLVVRLDEATRNAFQDHVRRHGGSASGTVRDLIRSVIAAPANTNAGHPAARSA